MLFTVDFKSGCLFRFRKRLLGPGFGTGELVQFFFQRKNRDFGCKLGVFPLGKDLGGTKFFPGFRDKPFRLAGYFSRFLKFPGGFSINLVSGVVYINR